MAMKRALSYLTCLFVTCQASYRHVSLSSPDLCLSTNSLSLAPGLIRTVTLEESSAVILTIIANNGKVPFRKCDLKIKSSPDHGLMVRVETGALRQSTRGRAKCIDYLQLGRDDSTPFYTWDKTEKLCGEFSGTSYTDNNGELLIWLRLGEWDNLDTKESVHLSLVITQFRFEGASKYRACHSAHTWIRREYFCDGRVNCAKDARPVDEDEAVCKNESFHAGLPTTSTTLPSGPPLNLLSITLILVSVAVILFLLCLLIVRLRAHSCLRAPPPHSNSCELPDTAVVPVSVSGGGHPTSLQPLPHVYLDLSSRSLLRGSTPDAEPPPAYNDLFPPGYKHLLKCEERLETVTEQSSEDNTKEIDEDLLNNEPRCQVLETFIREDNPENNTEVQLAQT